MHRKKTKKARLFKIKETKGLKTLCGTTLVVAYATALLLPISKTVRDNGDCRLLLLFRLCGVRADAPGRDSSVQATDSHRPSALCRLLRTTDSLHCIYMYVEIIPQLACFVKKIADFFSYHRKYIGFHSFAQIQARFCSTLTN